MRRPPRGSAPATVTAYAAAKVNLGWRVGNLRADGCHEILGNLHTISLHDTLHITVGPQGFDVDGPEATPDLESDDNLVVRAAAVLSATVEAPATHIRLHKRIPVGAGLGGGSADAAAALLALAFAWGARLSARQLLELGALVGSDVPAIIAGGLVHCEGRGEIVRNIGCADGTHFVLAMADEQLSTPEIYRRFDELPAQDAEAFTHNDLQAAALAVEPRLADTLEALKKAGAVDAFVSGSGPTCVGIALDAVHARKVAVVMQDVVRRVETAQAVCWGVRVQLGASDAVP